MSLALHQASAILPAEQALLYKSPLESGWQRAKLEHFTPIIVLV